MNPIEQLFQLVAPQAQRQQAANAGQQAQRANPVAPVKAPPRGEFKASPNKPRYNAAVVQQIVDQYIAEGYDPKFAVGVAANAMIESGGDPNAYNKDEGAFGLFQHRNDRLDNLKAHADRMGSNASDLGAQVSFSMHELRGAERVAYDRIIGGDPQSAADYAALFDQYYERSDGRARDKRRDVASQIYSDMFGDGSTVARIDGSTEPRPSFETRNGNALSFGPRLGAMDPMQGMGPGSENPSSLPFSMGREAGFADFMTPASADKLNMGQAVSDDVYQDAIMRFITASNPDFETDEEKSAAANYSDIISGSAEGGVGAGATSQRATPPQSPDVMASGPGANLSMGTGGNSPTQGSTTTASTSGETAAPKLGAVDRFMDMIYGTKDTGMSADERTDRKRAVGLALSAGFSSLSTGREADYNAIATQRMELQQTRRGNEALKNNAQGVADMMVAAGFADRAQLPFMGQEGMNAALSMLGQVPSRKDGEFTLPNSYRATLAQTLADSGQTELAQGIMTLNGDALETLYNGVTGQMVKPPGAEGAADTPRTPEEVDAIKQVLIRNGDQRTADLFDFMDRSSQNKVLEGQGGVDADVSKAKQIGADGVMLDEAVSADSTESLAAGYEASGRPDLAAAARAAGSYEEAKQVTDTMIAQQRLDADRGAVIMRGDAVADFIPDSMPDAEKLRAVARNAQTSEDLKPVYDAIAAKNPTTDEKLINLMQADPEFLKSYLDLQLAKAGKDPRLKLSQNIVTQEVQAATDAYIAGKKSRDTIRRDMATVTSIVNDPSFTSGLLEQSILQPAQRVLNSVLGQDDDTLLNSTTMTGSKLVETFANSNFTALSSQLSGAISNMETERFIKSFPNTGDTKVQMLAMAQYHRKIADIQDAEFAAMSEWLVKSENGEAGKDRNSMIDYINEQTKDLAIYQEISATSDEAMTEELVAGMTSGKLNSGDVVRVIDPSGAAKYVVVP